MSVVKHLPEDNLWILDHSLNIRSLYSKAGLEPLNFFDVKTPFYMDAQAARIADEMLKDPSSSPPRKKKKKSELINSDSVKLLERLEKNQFTLKQIFEPAPTAEVVRQNNIDLRTLVSNLEASNTYIQQLSIKNDNDAVKVEVIENIEFTLPPKSRCFVDDLINVETLLQSEKFDVILMDPPWENKHIKRVNIRGNTMGYELMSTEKMSNLLSGIVDRNLDPVNGTVLIWCTHSQKQQEAILEWASRWSLSLRAKWYWLKVTKSGVPVTELTPTSSHKLPYEMVWIFSNRETAIPENQMIISVPSGFHSHKPPLDEILKSFGIIEENGKTRCLELFGRYLLPGWTTFGREALKFQNLKYFKKVEKDK